MAVVYVDLESTLPSWYTAAVYAAGTTYAQNDYVIAAAASGLYSGTTAVLWKSIQNGNTGNALTEGAWWTCVVDGSATKPYKSLDPIALANSYTFYDSGTNKGKAIVADNNPDALAVGDIIGTWTIGWWVVYSITYSAPNTIITFNGTTELEHWYASPTGTDDTPATTYKLPYLSVTTQNVNQSGADENNPIKVIGGWDLTGTPARNGHSILTTNYIDTNSKNYTEFSYLGMVKQTLIRSIYGGFVKIDNCVAIGVGCYLYNFGSGPVKITNCMVCAGSMITSSGGLGSPNAIAIDCVCLRSYIATTVVNPRFRFVRCNVRRPRFGIMSNITKGDILFEYCTFSNGGYNTVLYSAASVTNECFWKFVNCLLEGTAATTGGDTLIGAGTSGIYVWQNFNNVAGDNRIITRYGKIFSDSSVRHTASGNSLRFEPNARASEQYPTEIIDDSKKDFLQVAVAANSQVTVTLWYKKSSSDAGFEARLICRGGQLAGISNDVTAVAADSTDWQQLTIQVTPTETGVLRFGFQVWGSATATCHIDDFGVSQ